MLAILIFITLNVFVVFLLVRLQIYLFRRYRNGWVLFQMALLQLVATVLLLVWLWTNITKSHDAYIAALVVAVGVLSFGSIWVASIISAIIVFAALKNKRTRNVAAVKK